MKQTKPIHVVVLLLVCFLCFAYPNAAKAGPITTLAAFTAGLAPGDFLNQFTGIADGTSLGSSLPFSGGPFSYTVDASPDALYGNPSTTTPGTNWLSTLDSGYTLNITFTSGNVTAVGGNFFNTDINGAELPDSVTVLLSGTSGLSGSVTLPASGDTPNDFWGFFSPTGVLITGLTITPAAGDYATVGNLDVGDALPEPGTFGLLVAGIAVGLLGKRLSRV